LKTSPDIVDSPPRASGAFISLSFWFSLLTAAALFAAATLSGKILDTERRAAEVAVEANRVEQLALEVHRLELKAHALETDPDYIAAVARQKLGPGTKAPPDPPETLTISPAIEASIDPRLEPLRPWMQRIAADSLLRARLLMAAAALVLFGFTFLHERRGRSEV
jgi:hypothetical protein